MHTTNNLSGVDARSKVVNHDKISVLFKSSPNPY
jgi:hypothetical protein